MGFFSNDKITKELLEKILSGVEDIAKVQKEQALKLDSIEKAQKKLSKEIKEVEQRVSKIEKSVFSNFNDILTQSKLLMERLKTILNSNFTIEKNLAILPKLKSLLDNMNKQIQITPLNNIDFENLNDSEKLLLAMVKEIEKITAKSSKDLGELIDKSARDVVTAVGKKIDNKETELNNQIVDNLEIVQHNLKLAIYSRNSNGVSADQIRKIVREETRLPGSRNSYL